MAEADNKADIVEVIEDEVVIPEDTRTDAEKDAEGFGWQTKDKWVEAGKAEADWVPATHFLKFGELKKQIIEKEKALSKQEKLFKLMKEHHLNVKDQAYKDAYAMLKRERQDALKENDLIKAEEIKDRIEELRDDYDTRGELPAEVQEQIAQVEATNTPPPEYVSFLARNPWYVAEGRKDQMSISAEAIGVAERANNPTISLEALLAAVEKGIRKMYPEKFGTPRSPQHDSGERRSEANKTSTKLTAEQLEVAKLFDMKPEDYAKQLAGYKGR